MAAEKHRGIDRRAVLNEGILKKDKESLGLLDSGIGDEEKDVKLILLNLRIVKIVRQIRLITQRVNIDNIIVRNFSKNKKSPLKNV